MGRHLRRKLRFYLFFIDIVAFMQLRVGKSSPFNVCTSSTDYGCQNVPNTIFTDFYSRGDCPLTMKEGQSCQPKCEVDQAMHSGVFKCYRGHIYNNFQCHTLCKSKNTTLTRCCNCRCPGIDMDGILVDSENECNCKKLFPKRCRGNVQSIYKLLKNDPTEAPTQAPTTTTEAPTEAATTPSIHNQTMYNNSNTDAKNNKNGNKSSTTLKRNIIIISLSVLVLFFIIIFCVKQRLCCGSSSRNKGIKSNFGDLFGPLDGIAGMLRSKDNNSRGYTQSFVEMRRSLDHSSNSSSLDHTEVSYTALE
jgi:hypothetical protein